MQCGFRVILFLWFSWLPLQAQSGPKVAVLSTSEGRVEIVQRGTGYDTPWAVAMIDKNSWLVTERDGRLLLSRDGTGHIEIKGVPKVQSSGQGGLLDIVLARDFAKTNEVFLTYAKKVQSGISTAVAVARLDLTMFELKDVREIFVGSGGNKGGRHFGSRVVEARDGRLFITIGERGAPDRAQELAHHNGSVIRINRDGSIPKDNPFVGVANAQPEIWSYGHRNPQGAALDATGQLWLNEHGPKGGDEVNKVAKGANFGWPVIGYGKHYSDRKVGVGFSKKGMEQPAYYWDPSIAPSGMMIYSGKMFPNWKGDFFIGSLKFDQLVRLDRKSKNLVQGDVISTDQTDRVRDVREAKDGSIWFLSVGNGAVYQIKRI